MPPWADAALPALVAALIGLGVAAPLSAAAARAGWLDPPGGHKRHARPVPFGGVLYVLPVWWLLFLRPGALFAVGGWILLLGSAEDVLKAGGREIPWWVRLLGFAAGLAFLWKDPALAPAFAPLPQALALLLLLAAVIAFNWLDHADGLAAAAGLGGLLALGPRLGTEAGVAAGLLAAFLIVNGLRREGALLYLGDAGAQLLGYTLVALALLGRENAAPPDLRAGLAVMFVPLLDALRVVLLRTVKGQRPWTPDREHHLGHLAWARSLPRGALPLGVAAVAFAAALALLRLAP